MEIFPLLNIFIAVLDVIYLAYWMGFALLDVLSISVLGFFPFQSPYPLFTFWNGFGFYSD